MQQLGTRAVPVPHSAIPDYQRGHILGQPDALVDRLIDPVGGLDGGLAAA